LFAPKPTATPKVTPTPKPTATPKPTSTIVATPKAVAVVAATPAPTATPVAAVASANTVTSASTPAGAACTPLPTTKAFQRVDGDTADYSIAPGGNFESGTSGWTLSNGAKIVSGNETLGVSSGSKALQIPLAGSATSPAFCVDESNPHFRFAYKVDNAVLSGFIAYVIYRDAAGKITNVELVSSKILALTPSTWQATPNSPLSTLLPLNATTKTASVQLKITSLSPTDFVDDTATAILGNNAATSAVTSIGGAATNLVATISGAVSPIANIGITVDSVMVDPYRRG
ncbi:MAG: hypothetical protein Q7T55_20015, partial [Solirubrobacteraceae bacterium]|nr:hypothetical protein [Solirubrobacteraceae bacterium]